MHNERDQGKTKNVGEFDSVVREMIEVKGPEPDYPAASALLEFAGVTGNTAKADRTTWFRTRNAVASVTKQSPLHRGNNPQCNRHVPPGNRRPHAAKFLPSA